MGIFSPTCHQLAERSYRLGKYQMPICARCQGIYIGYIISIFIYAPALSLLLPVTYIDGLIQMKTNYTSTNSRRLFTGILSGIATIQVIKFIISALI